MTSMPTHLYDPNVPNCSQHDMGDCPYHKDGPCMFAWDGETCGQTSQEHGRPAQGVWTPGTRLPVGQYRVTLLVTGDAVGPDILSWLIGDRTASMAGGSITARIEKIKTVDRGDGK